VSGPRILVVDDTPPNIRLIEAILGPRDYTVMSAESGPVALELLRREPVDLVLLDVVMPVMDGYEVCRRIRAEEATAVLPVIMVTSSTDAEKVRALDAGADDFIQKPLDRAELLARVRSLLRVKEYHDIAQRQAAELAAWNRNLEARVETQLGEIQRLARLRRFLSPQLADIVVSSPGPTVGLETHRRQISVAYCRLKGFTRFAEAAEPEDVMAVLHQFHDVTGEAVRAAGATVGHFAGDGLMVFFNDPLPCPDPAMAAARMALDLRERVSGLAASWRRFGHHLDVGAGITLGYATLGEIGFEGRFDYGAVGSVVNLAERLSERAEHGQVLISQAVYAVLEGRVTADALPQLEPQGFANGVPVYNLLTVDDAGDGQDEGAPSLPDGLTRREAEVLRLLAAGRSSREIGDELVLSTRTVERHISNLYGKINAHGRAEATAYAISRGLVP
jgi:adenylate cyclase